MAAQADNVGFTPTAGGTTDWTYSASISNYATPTQGNVVNGLTYEFMARDTSGNWELARGACTITGGIPTFARTTVLMNSAGTGTLTPGQSGAGTKINFAAAPSVYIVTTKESSLLFDETSSFTATQKAQARTNIAAVLKGHLFALTLSTAGSSTTLSVAAGECADSTAADLMVLGSALSKTTSNWAVGNAQGGFDGGSTFTNNTWYHWFIIKRPDTGVTDAIFSASAISPNFPANYTLFRRIGSAKVDGSGNWTKFVQLGDTFLWDVPTTLAYAASATASLQTINTPLGIKVQPVFSFFSNGVGESYYFSSPDTSDQTPGNTLGTLRAGASYQDSLAPAIWTNTSSQIRVRADGTAGTNCQINTQGWIDTRGRLF